MAHSDYERLREAFRYELELWPPSQQGYETTLAKAKMNFGLSSIRLSQPQKDALYQMYLDAAHVERAAKTKKS